VRPRSRLVRRTEPAVDAVDEQRRRWERRLKRADDEADALALGGEAVGELAGHRDRHRRHRSRRRREVGEHGRQAIEVAPQRKRALDDRRRAAIAVEARHLDVGAADIPPENRVRHD
jgi:hypothetical protein